MTWKKTNPAKERARFVLEWEDLWNKHDGRVNMSALCREYGISRPIGYLWVERYRESGNDLRGLEERSRRPTSSPSKLPPETEAWIVATRKRHPRWGPRKLRQWMLDRRVQREVPSASAIGAVLKRSGLATRRGRRRRSAPLPGVVPPFATCDRVNATWCIDFKGKFQTGDGRWCHVLTLVDAYTRYLLRCELVRDPDGTEVERVVRSAFTEFGLPDSMRSDNGPPFASTGAGTLTRLSIWWLRLGIRVERIAKGRPDQNGRLERLHRSLEEVIESPAKNAAEQQRPLDRWRNEYNQERPHEALKMRTPASLYAPSPKLFPCPLIQLEAAAWNRSFIVDENGCIRWQRRKRVLISSTLAGEIVEVERVSATRTLVRFGAIVLGWLDEEDLKRGLILAQRRKKGDVLVLNLLAPNAK